MIEIKNEQDIQKYQISTRLLMKVALEKGYQLSYFPSSSTTLSGITRCVKDKRELFFKSTVSALTPSYGVFAAENKALTYSLLSMNNVPTPTTMVIAPEDSIDAALSFLNTFQRVVVKPVDTNHGDGITVGVKNKADLRKSIAYARAAGGKEPDIIVQQQVDGNEYRFLVVNSKVIAVASRRPPYVVGDGKLTVEQLIHEKNQDPRRGEGHTTILTKISLDDVIQHRSKDFLSSIPEIDEVVEVLDTSNLSRGGESVDFTDIASPALKGLAVEAAERCFAGVAGVDIMTKDITAKNTDESNVIEINLSPGIRMHEFPTEGKTRNVAQKIFEAFEKTSRPIDGRTTSIGRSESIRLPEIGIKKIPARIDTGATISSIWASSIEETAEGLSFTLFDKGSEYYTGEKILVKDYGKRAVSSSMGHTQLRFTATFLIVLHGRRIRAKLTLADRSTQTYPILIGRNILRNKFIVNVATGKPLITKEKDRRNELDMLTNGED